MDAYESALTLPLLAAVVLSMISQFLVGYNTSVMNAPQNVVFPQHTTIEWSLAVSAFAIGGPFGNINSSYIHIRIKTSLYDIIVPFIRK
jgi:hypothetical protein